MSFVDDIKTTTGLRAQEYAKRDAALAIANGNAPKTRDSELATAALWRSAQSLANQIADIAGHYFDPDSIPTIDPVDDYLHKRALQRAEWYSGTAFFHEQQAKDYRGPDATGVHDPITPTQQAAGTAGTIGLVALGLFAAAVLWRVVAKK